MNRIVSWEWQPLGRFSRETRSSSTTPSRIRATAAASERAGCLHSAASSVPGELNQDPDVPSAPLLDHEREGGAKATIGLMTLSSVHLAVAG